MHYEIYEGWKRYEITNHLGNVLAVITDRKRGLASSGSTIQWYEADVLTAQQYYPFGMPMPDHATDAGRRRQYSLNGAYYRYGFNGKEGDDEVKGDDNDNQQDYGMRIYDPRVGRFLSVDPLEGDFPWYSPYHFAGNMPIWAIDLDGAEPKRMFQSDDRVGYAIIVVVDPNYIKELTTSLAEKKINVGLNIIKNDPNGLNIYLIEEQFYQGNSTKSPNISSRLTGIRRPQVTSFKRLPQRQPEIVAPSYTPNLPNVETPIVAPPPPPPPLSVGKVNNIRSDIGVVPATPGHIAQFPLNAINIRTLRNIGRQMRATELSIPIRRFDIKITVQSGTMAPNSVINMINSVMSVSGQIIAGFKTIGGVVAPISIAVGSNPTAATTFSVTPIPN